MDPFEMLVWITFLCVVGGIASAYFKARERRDEGVTDARIEADELRSLIVSLEDRIRVLERIVTDTSGRDDLRRQFRELER